MKKKKGKGHFPFKNRKEKMGTLVPPVMVDDWTPTDCQMRRNKDGFFALSHHPKEKDHKDRVVDSGYCSLLLNYLSKGPTTK